MAAQHDPRADAPAQLTVSWRNYDGTATIYLDDTEERSQPNLITIEIANTVGGPVTFPAGAPAAYASLPTGQSAVYLFFNGLVSASAVTKARLSASGWSAAAYTDTDGRGYLAIAPDHDTALPSGGKVAFTLTDLVATGKPVSGHVTLSISGASGLTTGQSEVQVPVKVTQRSPANQPLDLLVGFAGHAYVTTGADQDNALLLYLTNPGAQPLAPDGSASWGPTPPTFQLSFVCGTGPGALTTAQAAAQISVDLGSTYGNAWKPVQRNTESPAPYWIMQPSAPRGGQILGVGEQATVTVDITGIVTTLPPGMTYAHLSYTGIPGYDDGAFAIELLKVAPVAVTALTADPPSVTHATAAVPVTLKFTASNAGYVTVANTPYAAATTSASFTDQVTVEVSETTVFTVTATNPDTGAQASRSIEVAVTDPSPTVHALTVETDATVDGALTVTGTSKLGEVKASGPLTAPKATINGILEIDKGQLSVVFNSPTRPAAFLMNVPGNSQAATDTGLAADAPVAIVRNNAATSQAPQGGGLAIVVPTGTIGLWTSGTIHSGPGSAPLTTLLTSAGDRVASSPLTVEPELHLSGSARLTAGRAVICLPPDLTEILYHTAEAPYRVLLTPTAQCQGLAVTAKRPEGFDVEELTEGQGNATFDWLLIAHLRTAPGSPIRATLPTPLPAAPDDLPRP
jgi:hypothetical protein